MNDVLKESLDLISNMDLRIRKMIELCVVVVFDIDTLSCEVEKFNSKDQLYSHFAYKENDFDGFLDLLWYDGYCNDEGCRKYYKLITLSDMLNDNE